MNFFFPLFVFLDSPSYWWRLKGFENRAKEIEITPIKSSEINESDAGKTTIKAAHLQLGAAFLGQPFRGFVPCEIIGISEFLPQILW